MTDVSRAPNRNLAASEALVEELVRAGVRDACICPGSRSAPLAVAAARCGELRRFTHIDERSAGFFALGLARAARRPVALVCTSGTAAANFHPAVIEAHYARVPLLVLTADRPPELREWGAGQTIDQLRLYGPHVRWFVEVALPDCERLRYVRALACRAVDAATTSPAGPVHLNLPFREPLDPSPVPGDVPPDLALRDPLGARGRGAGAYVAVRRSGSKPEDEDVAALAQRMLACERGVVAAGPIDATPRQATAVAVLARRLGWPLLAEPTSQLRSGPHARAAPVVAMGDLLLRDPRFAARHAPEFVLRLGGTPTSKPLLRWLEVHCPAELVLVDPDAAWNDPSHLASEVWRVEAGPLCEALARALGSGARESAWLDAFLRADRRAEAAVARELADDEALLEARAVRELAAALPEGATLYVSNSMPVRDLDAFWPTSSRPLRVLCNRGANGIDGMVSSALGAAAAGKGPVVLLTGDLALLHDLSGLLAAARASLPLTIVVLNNDGGGIFCLLPIAEHGEAVAFEEHFATPHGHDLEPLCRAAGARFAKVASWEHYHASLKDALAAPGPTVIEVPVDRERNAVQHRALASVVASAWRGADAGDAT